MPKGCEECPEQHPAIKVANAINGSKEVTQGKPAPRTGPGLHTGGAGVTTRPPPEIRILRDECIPGLSIKESVVPGRIELRTLDEVVFADTAKKVWPQAGQPQASTAVNGYKRPPGLIPGVQIGPQGQLRHVDFEASSLTVANRAAPSVAAPLQSMDWVLREDDDVGCDSDDDGEYIPVNGRHDCGEGTPRSDSRIIRAKQESGWHCMLTSGLIPNVSMATPALAPPDDDAPDDEPDDPAGSEYEFHAVEV